MNKPLVARLSLVAALFCFIIAFLLTTGTFGGSNYRPWVEAGFIALVFALLIER